MSKKKQMLRLVSKLGSEARLDPSLLHPLFQRLPPLYADTPDAPKPPSDFKAPEAKIYDEPNPYDPIPLSGIFQLADRLQAKHPWDGHKIRGHEVMGPGSVVRTFAREIEVDPEDEKAALKEWSLADAEAAIDQDVVLPGGEELDEEPDLAPERWSLLPQRLGLRVGSNRFLSVLAVGMVVVGVSAALFGWEGRNAQWARWWGSVAGHWAAKRDLGRPWIRAYLPLSLRDVL